ncbi:MAG TPA: plastocyanin/azurin family copper-binding protein [Candidatus Paceibacterota bacterium]|nr:plastocyanin/azurin family copper-binding protein [Candidatus Paceibacterota bacterium]
MRNLSLFALLLILVGFGYLLWHKNAEAPVAQTEDRPDTSAPFETTNPAAGLPAITDVSGTDAGMNPEADPTLPAHTKVFNVDASNFSFSVKEMRVNVGDTVIVNFANKDGFHDWVIDEFNARSPRIGAGQSAQITFVADKKGSFEYYCSVGSHRAQGMWGTLVVE